MKSKVLFLLISCLITLQLKSQYSETQFQKIDSLFIEWNKPNHPGGAIGIMQDGKTVYSKAFGLASLEYLIPNSPKTIFNIGSVSKQFTAMGIVLLHQQGKLSVDDDIRKHLAELPDFGDTIRIYHLLHHTSGLRSLHAMLELAGWRSDDSRTNEDLNRFIKNQRDLNFKPGDEYLYCNTGYMLMVNIIEKITGEKFKDWMQKSVFEKLGMTHTYVEDKYNRVVLNNATSYRNEFDRAVEYWGYVGSGNVHSTTDDLLKWLSNFYDPQPNWETPFKMLQTLHNFNNGDINTYAFGINLDESRGIKRIQHGGSIGGFRAYICTYPEQKLNIVALTNFSSSSGGKVGQISNILLKNVITESEENEPFIMPETVKLPNEQLRKFEAWYWNDNGNSARKIYLKDDTLRYLRPESSESPLLPIGNDEFQMIGVEVDLKVKFESSENDQKTMIVTIDNDPPIISQSYNPSTPSPEELSSYTGSFYSPELETTYDIFTKDNKLQWHHARHGDFEMKVLKKDVLEGHWPFSIARIQRDENGIINGILVSNGRVRNLWFEKQ